MSPVELADLHAQAFDAGWSEAEFASLLSSPGVFLACLPGGFLLARQIMDEAEILTLAVAPTQRRQGIAKALVTDAANMARQKGAARLFLEVAVDNEAALALYTAAGFTRQGLRRAYYRRPGGGIDALVLSLAL